MSEVNISASAVKDLRDQTGAGMMDCKKALVEAAGDFDKAIELLRLRGQKMSEKRADRDAKEGVVIALVSHDAKRGIVVRVSCETDFVSKNEDFVSFTKEIANIALNNYPATLEDLYKLTLNGVDLQTVMAEQVARIGEKIEIADYQTMEAPLVASYIHMGNKAGVLVGLNLADDKYTEAGRDVAMQVAAMKPVALVAYPIMNSSLTNCIVLDPFGGSGSTLIACEQTERICYTIGLDEKFCDVIV